MTGMQWIAAIMVTHSVGETVTRCYYNEFDPKKAAWLKELIKNGIIAPGDVDERSIADVQADDLGGYSQCHFFAGIGIWSYALRLAGWPDEREVWTGSCPCQPFSAAGKGEAFNDKRHLWPELFRLIEARKPLVCFGEQVASIDGLAWLDLVQSDLDHAGYTCGAVDLCAAGFGAPHRRQRLYWVGDAEHAERRTEQRWPAGPIEENRGWSYSGPPGPGDPGRMADNPSRGCGEFRDASFKGSGRHDDGGCRPVQLGESPSPGLEERRDGRRTTRAECQTLERTGSIDGLENSLRAERRTDQRKPREHREASGRDENTDRIRERGEVERMDDAAGARRNGAIASSEGHPRDGARLCLPSERGPVNGFWRDADWVLTRPQRVGDRPGLRPVERGAFPLAHGTTARVGRLRGYGDGIVAQVASGFIRAYLELNR